MSGSNQKPKGDKNFDLRELVLMLYTTGGMFVIIIIGVIGLAVFGLYLNSVPFAVIAPMIHLGLCISLIVWAFKDLKKNRP